MPNLKFHSHTLPASAHSITPIEGGYLLGGPQVALLHPYGSTQFYRHGFHSWSLTSWLELQNPLPVPSVRPMWPHIDDPRLLEAYPFTGSDVGALQSPDGKVLLLGALTPGAQVSADEQVLRGSYESASLFTTSLEWFAAYGPEEQVFARYAALLGERLGRCPERPAPRVWCSWYGLYTNINEENILAALDGVRGLPFDVFQLDDGWEPAIGDWEANAKFPAGMAALADRIRAHGFTPGIWLAPFIVQPKSNLFQQHRDWLLHDTAGNLVPAGHNWGETFYALDVTHPDVQFWLAGLFDKLRSWGYDYLKIDFLYAAALPGVRCHQMPREMAYREGLRIIRQAACDDAYILVCGSPILASLGLADGMRIGPDVAPFWDNDDRSRHLHDLTGPSALNALRTSLHRLWLGPQIHIDPDVVYFRERYNLLGAQERGYIQDLARIANFRATSDLPHWLDPEERSALHSFLEERPAIQRLSRYQYRIGERTVDFGFVNL